MSTFRPNSWEHACGQLNKDNSDTYLSNSCLVRDIPYCKGGTREICCLLTVSVIIAMAKTRLFNLGKRTHLLSWPSI